MITIRIPRLRFSRWVSWKDRSNLRRTDGPWLGIYFWGRFDFPPGPRVRPYPALPRVLIYVGDTKHLDTRPLTGRHHRLSHYRDTYPDDPALNHLYLSICRIRRFPRGYQAGRSKPAYDRLRNYTLFLEAAFYWLYTKKWGEPPRLRYKKARKAGASR